MYVSVYVCVYVSVYVCVYVSVCIFFFVLKCIEGQRVLRGKGFLKCSIQVFVVHNYTEREKRSNRYVFEILAFIIYFVRHLSRQFV